MRKKKRKRKKKSTKASGEEIHTLQPNRRNAEIQAAQKISMKYA